MNIYGNKIILSSITADMSNKKPHNSKLSNYDASFKCEVILSWKVRLHL